MEIAATGCIFKTASSTLGRVTVWHDDDGHVPRRSHPRVLVTIEQQLVHFWPRATRAENVICALCTVFDIAHRFFPILINHQTSFRFP
ncbi:hypothetical protein L209DRAFT_750081 [Thermothelomyces heterothallicus CBS 203.75]